MRTLLVIGIGTGNPEHVTIEAINALNRADLVLVPRKGEEKTDLAELRLEICRRYLTDGKTRIVEFDVPKRDADGDSYCDSVDDWHAAIAGIYRALIDMNAAPDATVAFLVWGDPSLYDSTLRILERLRSAEDFSFEIKMIPGISSVQALAASHAIPLNTIANAVHITTGRKLRDGFPDGADSVVVMLDGEMAFRNLPADAFDIYWGAYLGSAHEITISGRLADVVEKIAATRASARERHGWIMDTYLLRRVGRS